MAVRSPFPDVYIPEVSLHEFILNKAEEYDERLALVEDDTGRTVTFKDFTESVRRVAQSLHSLGFQKNDVVALYLPNLIEYPILFYGTLLAGGTVAGISIILAEGEARKEFENSSPRIIFTLPNMVNKAKKTNSESNYLQEIFTITGHAEGFRSYTDFMDLGVGFDKPEVKVKPKEDVAVLTYTTGTTGRPKGAMITHYNFVATVLQISFPEVMTFSEHDIIIATRPVIHAYGLCIHITGGLYNGCTQVFTGHYDTVTLLRMIDKYKVTMIPLTPLNLAELAKPHENAIDVTTSLRRVLCAGAYLNENVHRKFTERFTTTTVTNVFGMSEVLFSFMPRKGQGKGVGVPLPNVEVKIVDPVSGDILGPYARGEIWLQSPAICKGYKGGAHAETDVFIEDGWFKTGDLAYFDDDLNFYIFDRIKELISYNAAKVSPIELETLILELPGVSEVSVIGVPDEDHVELARAFVVKRAGESVTEQDVMTVVKRTLSPYKWLHGGVEFVDSFPQSPSGKILRRILKENMLKRMTDK